MPSHSGTSNLRPAAEAAALCEDSACFWYNQPLRARRTGGRPQRSRRAARKLERAGWNRGDAVKSPMPTGGDEIGAGSDFSCPALLGTLSVVSGRIPAGYAAVWTFPVIFLPARSAPCQINCSAMGKGCISSGSRATMSAISGGMTRGVLSGDGYIFLREGWHALRYPIKRRGLILILSRPVRRAALRWRCAGHHSSSSGSGSWSIMTGCCARTR
jgi:hypothetical protein